MKKYGSQLHVLCTRSIHTIDKAYSVEGYLHDHLQNMHTSKGA